MPFRHGFSAHRRALLWLLCRLLSMLTCRAAVSNGKQVETVSDEGRDPSLRATSFIAVNKFTPDCFLTVKSENVQFVIIRSLFDLILTISLV